MRKLFETNISPYLTITSTKKIMTINHQTQYGFHSRWIVIKVKYDDEIGFVLISKEKND